MRRFAISAVIAAALGAAAAAAQADIYQWMLSGSTKVVDTANLCPDGSGVDPDDSVDLSNLDLTQAYLPGLITGLLYAPLFVAWAWLLKTQGNVAWATFWLAWLVGLALSVALAGFAYFGRRVFR